MPASIDNSILSIDIYNSIFSPLVSSGANLIANNGFESGFTSWTQDTDGGNATITQASSTPDPYEGTYYCEIYSVNGGDVEGSVYQNISVTAGERYRVEVWSRTSDIFATMQGRVAIYDVTNAAWIIPREPTGIFESTEWQNTSLYFNVPEGCTQVRLYLYQNIDGDSYVYYDNVIMHLVQPAELAFFENYSGRISSYTHSITANVGFDKMQFTTAGPLEFMGEWIESGLSRHIVVRDAGSGILWEGFINKVTMNAGGFRVSVGPVVGIINRMRMAYSLIDWNTTPPVGGDSVVSQWVDDIDSMSRYGILEGVVSGGEADPKEMYSLMPTLLKETAWAPSESSYSFGGSGNVSIDIECLGYAHLLDKYYYKQVFSAGEENASEKLKDIIVRDPNGIITYAEESVEENTSQVEVFEDGSKTALAILKELANLGGAEDNRYIFGVYENGLLTYNKIENEIKYSTKMTDGRIEYYGGGYVDPWTMRPGFWLLITDLFPGRAVDFARPSEDPRMIFIESITYNAPYGLSINGGRASTFRQMIERLGLGGL